MSSNPGQGAARARGVGQMIPNERLAEHSVVISEDLIAAYEAADYWVDLPSGRAALNVGKPMPSAPELPEGTRLAIVTACNPFSRPLDASENAARQKALIEVVEAAGLAWFPAAGTDPSGAWEPEPSAGVIGASEEQLDDWMERFGQNAVVVGPGGGQAGLRFHPRAMMTRERPQRLFHADPGNGGSTTR